jgi:hypothetical protein
MAWDILSSKFSSFCCLLNTKGIQLAVFAIIAILLAISTIVVVCFLLRKSNLNESSGYGKVLSARKSATLVTDFLLTYIVPLIAFDFTSVRDIILFLIYFALIAFLNIRNGNVYTNILFEFMGYRVFTCDIEREITGKQYLFTDCTVISKENLTGKIYQEFSFFDFDNSMYLNLDHRKGQR